MKLPSRLALATTLAVTSSTAAVDPPAPPLPPVKDGYIKVRVEVETRGVLQVKDKSAVLLTRYRYYDQREPTKEVPEAERIPPYRVDLDFARAPELRELAKAMDGKAVIVTGLSELRQTVPPPPPPGGFTGGNGFGRPPLGFYPSSPPWVLQPAVLVTGLKSAPEKR